MRAGVRPDYLPIVARRRANREGDFVEEDEDPELRTLSSVLDRLCLSPRDDDAREPESTNLAEHEQYRHVEEGR